MGSGPRFGFKQNFTYFAVGFTVSKFPHSLSVIVDIGFWHVYFGFGKGYDE